MTEREPSSSSDTATEGRHRMHETDPHTRTDLITIAVGFLVLVGCALLARNELTDVEVSIFQAVNELPRSGGSAWDGRCCWPARASTCLPWS